MSDLKTKPTSKSAEAFLNRIADTVRKKDCFTLPEMMKQVTGESPRMWGSSIIGFGSYHCKYATGREGDWFAAGFSPRNQNITLYLMIGFEQHPGLMKKLGKYKTGKSCLYIYRLSDIDSGALKELISASYRTLCKGGEK